jgi:hypothetical protein
MFPFDIINTLLSLRSPRTPRITSVEWTVKHGPGGETLELGVTVVNDNVRPIRVTSAGTMHTPGTFNVAASVDGLPLDLADGQDGQLWLTPLSGALGISEPVRVWVRTAAGKRGVEAIPRRPALSSGDNGNGDF